MVRFLAAALCALALVPFTPGVPAFANPSHCVGCDFSHADLHGRNFEGVAYVGADFQGSNLQNASGTRFTNADLVGVDFRSANLRNADFQGSALCWRNVTHDRSARQPEPECADLRDADVHGANFRGVRLCEEHDGVRNCSNVDAATLKSLSRSPLEGATLP